MNKVMDKEGRTLALRSLLREGGAACAPMAGITGRPFRRLCRRLGATYVVTEFLSSEGLRRGGEKTLRLADFDEEERPIGIQLFGADPQAMAEGASIAADLGPDFIDINFGCPVKKVVRRNGGSACMKDPRLMESIMRAVNEAVELPVSVKIRAGWDNEHRNAPETAALAEELGLAFVTVHGRTRTQFFRGEADLEIVRQTREAVSIPVVGNGDVVDADSWRRMVEETGVDSVLVGRGAIGNPWVFAEIEAARQGKDWRPPGSEERIELICEHLDAEIEEAGEKRAVLEFRKHIAQYIKGWPGAALLRKELFGMEVRDEVQSRLRRCLHEGGI